MTSDNKLFKAMPAILAIIYVLAAFLLKLVHFTYLFIIMPYVLIVIFIGCITIGWKYVPQVKLYIKGSLFGWVILPFFFIIKSVLAGVAGVVISGTSMFSMMFDLITYSVRRKRI